MSDLPAPRVLFSSDTLGGVWSYTLELAAALVARGSKVALATVGGRPTARQRAETDRVPGLRLFPSEFRCEWMRDPWQDVDVAGAWLRDVEAEFRPDVIHLGSYAHAASGFRAPVLAAGHSCVLSWWEAVRGGPAPAEYDRYRESVTRGLRAAAAVVAPTGAMLRSLEQHYGPLPPSRVIPNGRSPHRFRPDRKQERVFACGRLWDDAKNLAALESAAASVPWPVEVAGPLEHPEGGLRPAKHVACLGVLAPDEVAARMSRAAICAHPARYEPFGLVPLEAALSGCALVLGDIPTLREIWEDAALYVDPEDPTELRRALLRLADSVELRDRIATRARHRALTLTPKRMADEYLDLYGAMVEPPPELGTPAPVAGARMSGPGRRMSGARA